jgi:hypothetical protein
VCWSDCVAPNSEQSLEGWRKWPTNKIQRTRNNEQKTKMTSGAIVIYHADNLPDYQIEVRIKDDTVWLNRNQLAALFDRDVKTVGKHINNALKEELSDVSVIAKFATTASDGKTYQVEHYNLEMIISVGYRVKSKRGVHFRIWANRILKEYLIKGFVAHHHIERIEKDVMQLKEKTQEIEFIVKSSLPPNQGVFFDGQIFDAYIFASALVKSADSSITLIDNYIDETVLLLLSKRKSGVKAIIYTQQITKQIKLDLDKHNQQYQPIEVFEFKKSHDRFLIIDNQKVYHIGASLKDLGKKWFAFSHININPEDILSRIRAKA